MNSKKRVSIFFIFAVALASSISIRPVMAQADIYHRFTPTAIYADGQDQSTLEIYTSGNINSVTIKPDFADEPVYQLYDDGSNGDRTAGDGVYSLGGINPSMYPDDLLFPIAYNDQNTVDLATLWLTATVTYTSGQSEEISFIALKIVSPNLVFPVEQASGGLAATEYAFFITDPAGETYTGSFPNITDYNGPAIAKKFYSIYPDEFDFINFMVVRGDLGMKAHAGGLRNPAANIGLNRTDYTAEYGSQGRLLAMMYSGFELLNHEIGHAWAAFAGETLGISNGSHWLGTTDINGVMSEGYETPDNLYFFSPNNDGTFKAGWSEALYAPLELYLMGMMPSEEVPDVHVLHDPDLTNTERVTANRVDTYTITDIMNAAGGSRDPAYPAAQTDFNLAVILLTDTEFSPAEYAYYSYLSREYAAQREGNAMTNFYTATGGRGTVTTRLADWGFPNIQAAAALTEPTSSPEPTPRPEAALTTPPAPEAESAPEATATNPEAASSSRPTWNFPICASFTGALILPLIVISNRPKSRK
ncbi:MAG: hypothetical protein H8E28_02610 [Anaerolineae bacterium]|nr:hypothetical protein [Anaerolineae bacterium]